MLPSKIPQNFEENPWWSHFNINSCSEQSAYHLTEIEAAVQRYSWEKVFWKYAANLKENTHAEVWFQ